MDDLIKYVLCLYYKILKKNLIYI